MWGVGITESQAEAWGEDTERSRAQLAGEDVWSKRILRINEVGFQFQNAIRENDRSLQCCCEGNHFINAFSRSNLQHIYNTAPAIFPTAVPGTVPTTVPANVPTQLGQ